jgi:prepilin-type N-terminal cleavage/methylation domain-containing protein
MNTRLSHGGSPAGQRRRRQARGFTFAEVLIALALMAVLMTAVGVAVSAASSQRVYNTERTDLVARARGVLDRIGRDMRVARDFDATDPSDLIINMTDGSMRQYQWDGVVGGNLSFVFTSTGSVVSPAVVLTDKVGSFVVSDATSPACNIDLSLKGTQGSVGYTITATPRKTVY